MHGLVRCLIWILLFASSLVSLPHNTRFSHLLHDGGLNASLSSSLLQEKRKKSSLMLFIAITSGPHHSHLRQAGRSTWLLPCIASPHCDYRFFVDSLEDFHLYPHLRDEALTFNDVVFRNSCELMLKEHPNPLVNYGNSPPIPQNLVHRSSQKRNITVTSGNRTISKEIEEEITMEIPDYPQRRRYKIDWKVCFMRWVRRQWHDGVDFHVFVEDDSFVCTENLLHQMTLLQNLSSMIDFRTGTPMYDGFDDSSTIMTRRIADVFVDHYLEPGLDCPKVFEGPWDSNSSSSSRAGVWLSWGNSWMSKTCNWSEVISERFHLQIHKPSVHCSLAQLQTQGAAEGGSETVLLPCVTRPLVLHQQDAAKVLTKEHSLAQQAHLCEYMLLIDKVKAAEAMHTLWHFASLSTRFHDFSRVFLGEQNSGWRETLRLLRREEEQCTSHTPAAPSESQPHSKHPEHYPCLFERNETESEVEEEGKKRRRTMTRRRRGGGEGGGVEATKKMKVRKRERRIDVSYRTFFSEEMMGLLEP